MFKNLALFSAVRSTKEAFGFYIFWFVITLAVGGILGLLLAMVYAGDTEHAFSTGVWAGTIGAIIVSTTLAVLVSKEKGILHETKSILLIVATLVLAALGGGFLGLIIPAYLTTRPGASLQTTDSTSPTQE